MTVRNSALRSPRWGTRIVTREPRRSSQPLLVEVEILRLDRNENLLRYALRWILAVELLEDAVDQPPRGEVLDLVENESVSSDDAAAADVEDLHRRFQVVVGEADDIDVLVAIGNDLLPFDRPAHGTEAVAQPCRLLELEVRRRVTHLLVEALDDRRRVAVEEVAQLLDELTMGDLVDLADARPGALLDVEQQTGPAEALVLLELRRATCADRERAQQLVERLTDGVGVGVRAEVPRPLALAPAHHQRPWELLVDGDGEERIALVVTQADVEARVVLLDQRVLEHQRLDLVAHRGPLDGLGEGDHLPGPRGQRARIGEVVGQALSEARRLADIDDPAGGVLELVRARGLRDRARWWTLDHHHRGYG